MAAASRRRAAHPGHAPSPGLAVCELLASFAVAVALALLLIAALPATSLAPASATGPAERPTFRLHDALMNLQLCLEAGMIEAYDGWFHAAGDRPLIIDVFPGIDTSATVAAEAEAEPLTCASTTMPHREPAPGPFGDSRLSADRESDGFPDGSHRKSRPH